MPRVGSSKIRMSQSRSQPFGDHDLLLVAAREVADLLLQRGRLDRRGARRSCSAVVARCRLSQPKAPSFRKRASAAITMLVSTSMPDGEAEALAILRQVADAVPRRHRAGVRMCDLAAVHADLARRRSGRRRRSRAPPRCAPRPSARRSPGSRPCELEADVLDGAARGSGCCTSSTTSWSAACRAPRAPVLEMSRPTIMRDDRLDAASCGRHRVDVAAVAHHGDAVGDPLQFVHLVRDVDDADAVALAAGG